MIHILDVLHRSRKTFWQHQKRRYIWKTLEEGNVWNDIIEIIMKAVYKGLSDTFYSCFLSVLNECIS